MYSLLLRNLNILYYVKKICITRFFFLTKYLCRLKWNRTPEYDKNKNNNTHIVST